MAASLVLQAPSLGLQQPEGEKSLGAEILVEQSFP
jgi:hypothetical protein